MSDWQKIEKEAKEAKRAEVFCQDGLYREYLERYRECYRDEPPLSIGTLHHFVDRLNEIGAKMPEADTDECEEFWQRYGAEIDGLEYWICA